MENYEYKGVPITPLIIESLVVELFNGKISSRDDIVNNVLEHHEKNGGLKPNAMDFARSVKKALENMAKRGWAKNPSHGYWAIKKEDSPTVEEENSEKEDVGKIEENVTENEITVQNEYGKGCSTVYLYYFDNYKKHALSQNNTTWPCKIGRTDRDPLIRILSQASTAMPEKPIIDFIIKTDDASTLETMLHSILKVRGRQIKDSPGAEWFETNPQEVIEVVKFVNNDLLDNF